MPNPNGANQHTPDPREQRCWDLYVESIQNGQPNAYQAAVDAGYEEKTARQITVRSWFIERADNLRRKQMLSRAERNLSKILDMNPEDNSGQPRPEILRIIQDTSKHVTKTLGKKYYSERLEHTGQDGKPLVQNTVSKEDEELLAIIAEHARNRARKTEQTPGASSDTMGTEVPD